MTSVLKCDILDVMVVTAKAGYLNKNIEFAKVTSCTVVNFADLYLIYYGV